MTGVRIYVVFRVILPGQPEMSSAIDETEDVLEHAVPSNKRSRDMVQNKHLLAGTISTVAALCSVGSLAGAAPASLKWSTYAHTGPGEAYPVVAELEHDSSVQVEGASGRWRRIRLGPTVGWIDADALSLPRPSPHGAPPPGATCVEGGLTGWIRPTPNRYCLTATTPPPSR